MEKYKQETKENQEWKKWKRKNNRENPLQFVDFDIESKLSYIFML